MCRRSFTSFVGFHELSLSIGLPGTFRQALSEIGMELAACAKQPSSPSSGSDATPGSAQDIDDDNGDPSESHRPPIRLGRLSGLFIPTPNTISDTGLSRGYLLPNPSRTSDSDMEMFYRVGQLLGIVIRSRSVMSVDFADHVWIALVGHGGIESDQSCLAAVDEYLGNDVTSQSRQSIPMNEATERQRLLSALSQARSSTVATLQHTKLGTSAATSPSPPASHPSFVSTLSALPRSLLASVPLSSSDSIADNNLTFSAAGAVQAETDAEYILPASQSYPSLPASTASPSSSSKDGALPKHSRWAIANAMLATTGGPEHLSHLATKLDPPPTDDSHADLWNLDAYASVSTSSAGLDVSSEDFYEYYDVRYEASTSNSRQHIELLHANGSNRRVHYDDRRTYSNLVRQVRSQESILQLRSMRAGLLSIIPAHFFALLNWREVKELVSGSADVSIDELKRHTIVRPTKYTGSPIVQTFWKVLESLSAEERAKFLQFAWARSRLPMEPEGRDRTYRMQLSILEIDIDGHTNSHDEDKEGDDDEGGERSEHDAHNHGITDRSGGNSGADNAGTSLDLTIQTEGKEKPSQDKSSDQLKANKLPLPTSETCFFNVNVPNYPNLPSLSSFDILKSKLLTAIQHCASLTM